MIETGGQLVLSFRRTGGIFHDGTNCADIKFHGLFSVHKTLDELGDLFDIFAGSGHFIVEVCADLEELIEFLIIIIQHIIIIAAADHDDLDLGRDRFGF